MSRYGVSEKIWQQIIQACMRFPDVQRIILYGSRARGDDKPGSDIDLSLYGAGLTSALCATIAEALDDLLLPYSIDLSVFAELKHPELEAHIQRVGVVFFERKDHGSGNRSRTWL